jgi:methionine sulfoxide reductase heme-binding subunit
VSGGLTWYLARSLGIVAYALLTASMLWGLWLSTRTPARQGRAWLLEVHRALGGLAVLFVLGHLGALVADSYIDFGMVDLFVPFASSWQPSAVAWGVLAFYLLAAVEVTSLLRRTLTRRSWRKVHLAAFAAYLMATAHFLTAGTDAGGRLVLSLTVGGVALVVTGTTYRIVQHLTRPTRVPRPTKERSWSPPPPPMAPPTRPALLPPARQPAAFPTRPPRSLPEHPPVTPGRVRSPASAGGPSPSAQPASPPPAA